ncbi:hypothetical protein [Neomesorhizobium albiziae]|uniref:hypothetical protein n=1 Tax=Neomesorhizobium albiziae TaxID=335020 RepID=UPI00165EC067|nr:hypothetical protein [Mesorhizobium albiziae]
MIFFALLAEEAGHPLDLEAFATGNVSCRDDHRLQQRRGGIGGRNPKDDLAFKESPP